MLFGTYRIGDQQMFVRAQTRQSIRCTHSQSNYVDKGTDQRSSSDKAYIFPS